MASPPLQTVLSLVQVEMTFMGCMQTIAKRFRCAGSRGGKP